MHHFVDENIFVTQADFINMAGSWLYLGNEFSLGRTDVCGGDEMIICFQEERRIKYVSVEGSFCMSLGLELFFFCHFCHIMA